MHTNKKIVPSKKQECSRKVICKSILIFAIEIPFKGVQMFIQFYMLGFVVTQGLLITGFSFYLISLALIIRGCAKDFYRTISRSLFLFKFSFLFALTVFFLSCFYPVRYTINNPEALNINRIYQNFEIENRPYDKIDPQIPSKPQQKDVPSVYYLLDMCQQIFRFQIQGQLENSSKLYCQDLINGKIQENNFSNLNPLQKGLIFFFVLTLIQECFCLYFQCKVANQYLVFLPIPPKKKEKKDNFTF